MFVKQGHGSVKLDTSKPEKGRDYLGEMLFYCKETYGMFPYEIDLRFFDGENFDRDAAKDESIATLSKLAMTGDFKFHKKVAECPRCRRHTPECYFDNNYLNDTECLCNRCLVSTGVMKCSS